MNNFNSLLWFSITIACYLFGSLLQKITKNNILVSPPIIAIILLIFILNLKFFNIEYSEYMKGAGIISFFLGLTTIALAVPLYKHKDIIYKNIISILFSIFISIILSVTMSYCIAKFLHADKIIQLSIITKSVTTPIALLIAEKIGAVQSLCIMFIFSTGMFGAVFGLPLLSLAKIKNDKAIGLALGVVCHGLGVARAFQKNELCGLFAMLGMSIMGLLSGVIIPFIALVFFL